MKLRELEELIAAARSTEDVGDETEVLVGLANDAGRFTENSTCVIVNDEKLPERFNVQGKYLIIK